MHNGQTNTGSRGPKDVSPKAGFAVGVRRVGAIRVECQRNFALGQVPHIKLSLGSFSVSLDSRDTVQLIEALQDTAHEVFP